MASHISSCQFSEAAEENDIFHQLHWNDLAYSCASELPAGTGAADWSSFTAAEVCAELSY